MKRIEFLKSLAVLPFLKKFNLPVLPSETVDFDKIPLSDFSKNGMSAIHVQNPTVANIRAGVQSLAGRANHPFQNYRYHGLISKNSARTLGIEFFGESATTNVPCVSISGSGVTFKVVDFIDGAIIFGAHSDPLTLESR